MTDICKTCECSDYDHFDWCTGEVKMPTSINIKNTNQRNQIKVHVENLEIDPKTKKVVGTPSITTYLKPGEQTDVWIAETRRVTIQELPT